MRSERLETIEREKKGTPLNLVERRIPWPKSNRRKEGNKSETEGCTAHLNPSARTTPAPEKPCFSMAAKGGRFKRGWKN